VNPGCGVALLTPAHCHAADFQAARRRLSTKRCISTAKRHVRCSRESWKPKRHCRSGSARYFGLQRPDSIVRARTRVVRSVLWLWISAPDRKRFANSAGSDGLSLKWSSLASNGRSSRAAHARAERRSSRSVNGWPRFLNGFHGTPGDVPLAGKSADIMRYPSGSETKHLRLQVRIEWAGLATVAARVQ